MLKKFIFLISLFFFSNITIFLTAEIIPLKKPIQTKEEKDQKLLSDVLKPLPKPSIKKVRPALEAPRNGTAGCASTRRRGWTRTWPGRRSAGTGYQHTGDRRIADGRAVF